MNSKHKIQEIIALYGPTASGKSALALSLAKEWDGVIINADSLQVYKEIPLLSASPSQEEKGQAPHRLYNVLEGESSCTAAHWCDLATQAIEEVIQEGKQPILVGGTGFYLKSLQEGLSPIPDIPETVRLEVTELFEQEEEVGFRRHLQAIDPKSEARIPVGDQQRLLRALEVFLFTKRTLTDWHQVPRQSPLSLSIKTLCLYPERSWLYERINQRFSKILQEGAIEEVEALCAKKYSPNVTVMKAVGVPQIIAYLQGEKTKEEVFEEGAQETRRYAKRQLTWLRTQFSSFPWFEIGEGTDKEVPQKILAYLKEGHF